LLRFIGGLLNPAAEHVYDTRSAIAISMNTTRRSSIAGSMASPLLRSAAAEDRPNVLVVVLDDLGCHDLGYLGAADLKTSAYRCPGPTRA